MRFHFACSEWNNGKVGRSFVSKELSFKYFLAKWLPKSRCERCWMSWWARREMVRIKFRISVTQKFPPKEVVKFLGLKQVFQFPPVTPGLAAKLPKSQTSKLVACHHHDSICKMQCFHGVLASQPFPIPNFPFLTWNFSDSCLEFAQNWLVEKMRLLFVFHLIWCIT